MVELCRPRHSAAESSFFNFTLIKINAKSPRRGSGVSGASLVSLLGALGGFLVSSEASFGWSLELFTACFARDIGVVTHFFMIEGHVSVYSNLSMGHAGAIRMSLPTAFHRECICP